MHYTANDEREEGTDQISQRLKDKRRAPRTVEPALKPANLTNGAEGHPTIECSTSCLHRFSWLQRRCHRSHEHDSMTEHSFASSSEAEVTANKVSLWNRRMIY